MIVFLSGLLSHTRLWRHQIEHVRAPSEVLSPAEETPEQMVQAVLDLAPAKFALVGHSMGGWLALEVMRTAPSRVEKLCLINTTARSDSKEKRERRLSLMQEVEGGGFEAVVDRIVPVLVYNASVQKEIKEMFLSVGAEAFLHQELAMLRRRETLSFLSQIQCPTLVIHATRDANFSLEEHQELTQKIQGAKLACIEDTGHMSPMESPQAVTSLLNFWLTYF